MSEMVQVFCKNCYGENVSKKENCLTDIEQIVENGDTAFMLYSEHVKQKATELGYKVELVHNTNNNQIPVLMKITKHTKDS